MIFAPNTIRIHIPKLWTGVPLVLWAACAATNGHREGTAPADGLGPDDRIGHDAGMGPSGTTATPRTEMKWTVTVTESLPDCPSVEAGWERIATQTKWGEWRSESKMRGRNITTTVIPPATEPLQAGDKYVVKVGRFMRIRCRVLESLGTATGADGEMVFDAMGVALGGIVRARFRFTIFRGDDGIVMARAQEKIVSLPFLAPSKEILEREHRHTFRDLNASFLAPTL